MIVDLLLEATNARLLVFGPGIQGKGDSYVGDGAQDVLEQFIRDQRKDAVLKRPKDFDAYIKFFIDRSYSLFLKEGGQITVHSASAPRLGSKALQQAENELRFSNNTPVIWNGKKGLAGQFLYGQPGGEP